MEDFNPFSLKGKMVLVTGASSGIGKAIALACAKMGATIVITGRNKKRLNQTLEELPKGEHQAIKADLTKQEDIELLVDSLPKLDGLIHCAGIGHRALCKNISSEDIHDVFSANVEAPMLLQAAILTKKKIQKSASIVFIASRAANSPSLGNATYSASKGALISYSKCLALELAPRQIRVNCVCPGMIWTDLIFKGGFDKEQLEEAQLKYPLKRFGKPEDVANLAVYLLSDAANWMTGASLDLSGGGEGLLTM